MQVKKIIAKNFLNLGEQTYIFNDEQILTNGIYNDAN